MIIKNFPLGPSVNNYLRPIRATGRFVKTKEAQIFDQHAHIFKLRNHKLCEEIHETFKDKLIKLDFYLIFNKARFVSKKGEIKKKDYKNHIKLIEDAFFRCVGLDDSFVKSGMTEVIYTDSDSKEQCILVISEHIQKTLGELTF